MIYSWATATDIGLVRDHNEDSVAPRDMGIETAPFVVGVADGMGGHTGGEVASAIALQAALAAEEDVVTRVEIANRAVVDAAAGDPELKGMGTTLTLGSFADDAVEIGHVGDSRAYLLRGRYLEQITTDHSLVSEMVARGDITTEEAAVHPYRSVITRAIGLQPEVEVDREYRSLQMGDRRHPDGREPPDRIGLGARRGRQRSRRRRQHQCRRRCGGERLRPRNVPSASTVIGARYRTSRRLSPT